MKQPNSDPPKPKKKKVMIFRERVQGNTVYSIGFNSEHKENEDEKTKEEETEIVRTRPPPRWIIKPFKINTLSLFITI